MIDLSLRTKRILFLRGFLPVLAACSAVIVIAWPAINEFKQDQLAKYSLTRARIQGIAMTAPHAGTPAQLQVMKPEFTGRDTDGRPYRITAERVVQGLQMDMPMTLHNPRAELTLDETKQTNATLAGNNGVYDPEKKTLSLNGNIAMTQSDGYTLNAQDLQIDLTAGASWTNSPVTGVGPMGQLSAESMELRDKGEHIILHGKSKVILNTKSSS